MSLSAPSVDIRVSSSVTEINRDSTAKSVYTNRLRRLRNKNVGLDEKWSPVF